MNDEITNEQLAEWHQAEQEMNEIYESALGGFLVQFNRIEHIVSYFIRRRLTDVGLPDLGERLANESFSKRLAILQDITKPFPAIESYLSEKTSQPICTWICKHKSVRGVI